MKNTLAATLCLGLVALLIGCGGGDPEPEHVEEEAAMPCKYRPDCTAGPPVGSACYPNWCPS